MAASFGDRDRDRHRDRALWREARRLGPLPYSALGARPLTPPALGLTEWVVDFLDKAWEDQGWPDPFVAVVVSGDTGELARGVLEMGPRCLTALRYVLVDPFGSPFTMAAVARMLPLEEPAFLFPPSRPGAAGVDELDIDADDPPPPAVGIGPLATYLTGIPAISVPEIGFAVAAVEVASRLPSDLVEWQEDREGREGRWLEVRLVAGAGRAEDLAADELVEVTVPLDPGSALTPLGNGARPAAARYALHTGAVGWLKNVIHSTPAGVLAVVDDWTVETEPVGQLDQGSPGVGVALDQLRRVREPISGPDPVRGVLTAVTWRIG